MKFNKYETIKNINLSDRTWPDNSLTKAPIWCSVDLRDGNQALENPMTLTQKLRFFNFLVKIGFKEIEIGFPAASETEYEFTRYLIENKLIPKDVKIQVLTQARMPIILKTFEAIKGCENVIIHLYNSTSTLQREVVFNKDMDEIVELAKYGANLVLETAKNYPETNFQFEYSPESFTQTEMDFATRICNEVIKIWSINNNKIIINLPATVEISTPNVYADQIEYLHRNLKNRENILISLHAHNDRGCAVAASEMGLLAYADRIEGTLFGNGERTGNADIMTLAMNLFSQGVDPLLDFSDMKSVVEIYESSTSMSVNKRHPYAGNLVYSAFSGSHQDAIKKGMKEMEKHPEKWKVPYLPIDPMDVGFNYDPIIRINSQSGKGGVSYILEARYGLVMPKSFQKEVGSFITNISDDLKTELNPETIYQLYIENYVDIKKPLSLISYDTKVLEDKKIEINCRVYYHGIQKELIGIGSGVVSAFCNSIKPLIDFNFDIIDYTGHSKSLGSDSTAISYIEAKNLDKNYYGVGTSLSVDKSSLKAVVSCVNKMEEDKK